MSFWLKCFFIAVSKHVIDKTNEKPVETRRDVGSWPQQQTKLADFSHNTAALVFKHLYMVPN